LPASFQIPQTAHAIVEFSNKFPEEYQKWYKDSNYIIALACKTERDLWNFSNSLKEKKIKHSRFLEPDLGNSLTSLAIVPCPEAKKACSGLPLAGKDISQDEEKKIWLQKTKNIFCNSDFDLKRNMEIKEKLFELVDFIKHPENPLKHKWKFPGWFFQQAETILYNLPDDFVLEKAALCHRLPEDKLQFILGDVVIDETTKLLLGIVLENYPWGE
jgi:hypothetical protein